MHYTLCISLYLYHSIYLFYALHCMHFTLCISICSFQSVHFTMYFTLNILLLTFDHMHFIPLCISLPPMAGWPGHGGQGQGLMETQRRYRKRLLGLKEVGREKRQRVAQHLHKARGTQGGMEVGRGGDITRSRASDSPDSSHCSLSIFKLPASGQQAVKHYGESVEPLGLPGGRGGAPRTMCLYYMKY